MRRKVRIVRRLQYYIHTRARDFITLDGKAERADKAVLTCFPRYVIICLDPIQIRLLLTQGLSIVQSYAKEANTPVSRPLDTE